MRVAVMGAGGLGGVIGAFLARAGEDVALADEFVDRSMEQLASLPPETRGSMVRDLEAGKRLEIESLNGTVVRLGRELGVPTPLNFAVYAALKPFADGALIASAAPVAGLAGRA